ncbi:MAG: hypothetical protein Q9201_004791 [Fulgogasparrea decipioides]
MPRIEDANSLPLAVYRTKLVPSLDPFPVHGESQTSYGIRFESSTTIAPHSLETCFNLIASSSANAYASSSIGWSPAKKLKEMKLPDLCYLLLTTASAHDLGGRIEGFLSFMLTYEDGYEVVYCYELHLSQHLQGRGIGSHLMDLMEQVGRNAGVEKSMLTVFVENQTALAFYKKLGYTEDTHSPEPRKMRNGTVKMPTYIILSKLLQER